MLEEEPKKPEIVVFAGPNGSGKSTIIGTLPHFQKAQNGIFLLAQ